jgi:hypothetical protein
MFFMLHAQRKANFTAIEGGSTNLQKQVCGIFANPVDVPDFVVALSEIRAERVERALGYLDTPRRPAGFHAAGNVHRVTPHVVHKAFAAYQTSDNRSGVYSNAQIEARFRTRGPAHLGQHCPCERHGRLCVVGSRVGYPCCSHIGIANGLYLLDTMLIGKFVETGK